MGAGLDPPFENHVGHDDILRKCPFDMWTKSGLIQKTLYVHYFKKIVISFHIFERTVIFWYDDEYSNVFDSRKSIPSSYLEIGINLLD